MDTQNISRRVVKHRRSNSPAKQNEQLVRKKVNIPDDTWLEALKFLTCRQWSQNRYVCRQIDGIVERNISRLPKVVLDCASMYYINRDGVLSVNKLDKYAIVSFDAVLQKKQSTQYFKNRGFTLSAPVGIKCPPKNVLLNARSEFYNCDDRNVSVCIHGSVKEKVPLSFEEKLCPWFRKPEHEGAPSNRMEIRKPVLFYAQFNPVLNECSWDYLAQFLKLVYHPTSHAKEVKMFAVNQDFIDALECNIDSVGNKRRYIHCESFSLLVYISNPTYNDLPESLKWLPQNVRAETIHLPWLLKTSESFGLITDFLLDPFGAKQCASEMVTIQPIGTTAFLKILIKKFLKIALVEDGIPTIEFRWNRHHELPALIGPNLIHKEVDSEGAEALHVISNGPNRMRISFRSYNSNWEIDICRVRIYSV